MKFKDAEQYRKPHPLGFKHKVGDDFGWFLIPSPHSSSPLCVMVAPSNSEWQHISVSLPKRCPNWIEMSLIKQMFFDEEEVVVQFHPKRGSYVNVAKTCLHMWSWQGGDFPMPPNVCV